MTPHERAKAILVYAQRDGRDMLGTVERHIEVAVADAKAEQREADAKIALAHEDEYEHLGIMCRQLIAAAIRAQEQA